MGFLFYDSNIVLVIGNAVKNTFTYKNQFIT